LSVVMTLMEGKKLRIATVKTNTIGINQKIETLSNWIIEKTKIFQQNEDGTVNICALLEKVGCCSLRLPMNIEFIQEQYGWLICH